MSKVNIELHLHEVIYKHLHFRKSFTFTVPEGIYIHIYEVFCRKFIML